MHVCYQYMHYFTALSSTPSRPALLQVKQTRHDDHYLSIVIIITIITTLIKEERTLHLKLWDNFQDMAIVLVVYATNSCHISTFTS